MATRIKYTGQRGQGMVEYIIIVALIALAAIAAFAFFGDTVRGQVGVMSASVAGEDASSAREAVQAAAESADGEAATQYGLDNYEDSSDQVRGR